MAAGLATRIPGHVARGGIEPGLGDDRERADGGRNDVAGLGRHEVLGDELLGGELEGRGHDEEGRADVEDGLAVEAGLPGHGGPGLAEAPDVEGGTGAGEVLVAGVEEGVAVGHGGIVADDAPDEVALEGGGRGAEEGGDTRKSVEVVVDDDLTGDADDLAPGLDAVALLGLADGAALELAGLVDLLELRRLAELEAVDVLEVGGGGAPGDGHEGARRRVVGVPQRLVRHGGEELGEVAGGVERPGRDLVAGEAADPHALAVEEGPGHLDEAEAPPLARGLGERVAAGIEAVKESRLDRGAAGLGGIEGAGPDVRAGLDRPVALGRLVDQEAPGLVQAHAAADEVIGDPARGAELAGGIGDAGHPLALLGQHPLGDATHRLGVGLGVTSDGLLDRNDSGLLRRHLGTDRCSGRCLLPRLARGRRCCASAPRPDRPRASAPSRCRAAGCRPWSWSPRATGVPAGSAGRDVLVGVLRKPAPASAPTGTAESSTGCQSTARQSGASPSRSVTS